MSQLKKVVDPFGEVNVYPTAAGRTRVVATILMEPHKEGTQTGIALDGSGSMAQALRRRQSGGILSAIFGGRKQPHNEITPVAQKLCAYLARKIDADGGTTCIYWAVGPGGGQIEVVGDLTADQAEQHVFGPPRDFGTGTQLLPAVRYFVDRFTDAPWGFYVFITDGELHDLDAVKEYSTRLARRSPPAARKPLKFVLIGIGPDVNEGQMEELDDLDTGTTDRSVGPQAGRRDARAAGDLRRGGGSRTPASPTTAASSTRRAASSRITPTPACRPTWSSRCRPMLSTSPWKSTAIASIRVYSIERMCRRRKWPERDPQRRRPKPARPPQRRRNPPNRPRRRNPRRRAPRSWPPKTTSGRAST